MEYSYIQKLYYDNIYNIKNIEENIQMIIYAVIGFFLPFILGHPQILVGTIVNAMLILGATYLRGYKILPIILLPSIGVMSAGVIFGTYTIYLLYLIPLIWLGNTLYVYVYKHINMKNKTIMNGLIGVGVASVMKAALLFGATFTLVYFSVLPTIFLTAMGILQITTAILGGIVAVGIIRVRERMVQN